MNFVERLQLKEKEKQDSIEAGENVVAGTDDIGKDSEFFGIENVRNMPPNLELRFADDDSEGLPYSLITGLSYRLNTGILIRAVTMNIKITGRDLKKLYRYLLAHRVTYIQAKQGTDIEETGLFVKEILIEEL